SLGDLSHNFALVYRYRLPRSAFAYTEEKIKELQFMEELEKKKKEIKELNVSPSEKPSSQQESPQKEVVPTEQTNKVYQQLPSKDTKKK
ncbi:MAG: hypothetical protein ACP5PT_00635, partial [Brevinematia bacterium]